MAKIIGIVGMGNMGSAIARQIKEYFTVYCYDKDPSKLKDSTGLNVSASIPELTERAGVILLSVKPQDFSGVLSEIKSAPGLLDKLFISIAAGIPTNLIEKNLGLVRVIRVMPNLAIRTGQGFSLLCQGKIAALEDLDFAENLFQYMGETSRIEEEQMDAATAISGSGPAYIFYDLEINKLDPRSLSEGIKQDYIDRLEKAALGVGFTSDMAEELARGTLASALSLCLETGLSLSELRSLVTSKGGTTEAAIEVVKKGGSWQEAALAAKKRALELSKH